MLSTSEEQEWRSLRDFPVIQTVYLQGKILSRVVTPERSGLPLGLAMLCGTLQLCLLGQGLSEAEGSYFAQVQFKLL